MKKLLVLLCSAGVLLMVGCSSEKVTPEDVGKTYMENRFSGAEANLTDLAYTVVDSGDDMATVSIEGTILYKEQIFLKKKNGKWAVTDEAPEADETAVAVVEPAAEEDATAGADVVEVPVPAEEVPVVVDETEAPVEEVAHH
ncbi:hypothetical protein [Desulfoluna sp.]|uniref:hypothetical protein n=1 Tax=Desulfoluna sp. TaxID=2045199 RepID=UPI00260DAA17|nr:hypothetical protein [Desulfoluna sp.]